MIELIDYPHKFVIYPLLQLGRKKKNRPPISDRFTSTATNHIIFKTDAPDHHNITVRYRFPSRELGIF
jgi:hypothetical protein